MQVYRGSPTAREGGDYEKIVDLEKRLRDGNLSTSSEAVASLRDQLKTVCRRLLLSDADMAFEKDVEQRLWKAVYYRRIEDHRKNLRAAKPKGDKEYKAVAGEFLRFLNEACDFYEKLLADMSQHHGLSLDHPPLPTDDATKAKVHAICFRILICLGDISRYRRDIPGTGDAWKNAGPCYERAHRVLPSNGNAHNQLAVLRTYVEDDFGAMYHYFRSMAVSNPFLTAGNNLKTLLERVVKPRPEPRRKSQTTLPPWGDSFAYLQAQLFYQTPDDVLAKISDSAAEFKSVLESVTNWNDERAADVMHAFIAASFYAFHTTVQSKKENGLEIPESRYQDLLESSVRLVLALLCSCIHVYVSTGAPSLLIPVSAGLLWLQCNSGFFGSMDASSVEIERLRIALSSLRNTPDHNPRTQQSGSPLPMTSPLLEDMDLVGYLPLLGFHETIDFSLPVIKDPAVSMRIRLARIANFVSDIAPVLTWCDQPIISPEDEEPAQDDMDVEPEPQPLHSQQRPDPYDVPAAQNIVSFPFQPSLGSGQQLSAPVQQSLFSNTAQDAPLPGAQLPTTSSSPLINLSQRSTSRLKAANEPEQPPSSLFSDNSQSRGQPNLMQNFFGSPHQTMWSRDLPQPGFPQAAGVVPTMQQPRLNHVPPPPGFGAGEPLFVLAGHNNTLRGDPGPSQTLWVRRKEPPSVELPPWLEDSPLFGGQPVDVLGTFGHKQVAPPTSNPFAT